MPDRGRVSAIYHDALARPVEERAAFIRKAAGSDDVLRREVESLLGYHDRAAEFMEVTPGSGSGAPPGSLIGRRLGSYEITARLGEGGMGVVYRAHDHTLGRDVALKILPGAFAQDPDRSARFEREARALAALNHPHIAQVFGLEQHAGVRAIAMELVDGPTLADMLDRAGRSTDRGGLPMRDALKIARQIADALECAHEAGIIHRDLKPANIKVRDDGTVKVLDFGLARAMDPSGARGDVTGSDSDRRPSDPASQVGDALTVLSPEHSPAMTAAGVILGTAAYMAPEQAVGKSVDRRADAWAFGVVLYEMLTGRRAFDGRSVTDVLRKVINEPIPLDDLPADTPEPVRRILRRCLEHDRRNRLADLSTARLEIDDALAAGPSTVVRTAPAIEPATSATRFPWRLIVAAVVVIAVAGIGLSQWPGKPRPEARATTVEVRPPSDLMFTAIYAAVALSPDGYSVVFGAGTGFGDNDRPLWMRALDATEARPIPGTEGANAPIFSPDGRAIAFHRDSKWWRLDLAGGSARPLCETISVSWGGAWSPAGYLILGLPEGLMRVPEQGGTPVIVTHADKTKAERGHGYPQFLPDGRVLFQVQATAEHRGVYIVDAAFERPRVKVLATAHKAEYVPGETSEAGHLLWIDRATLLAQRFRLDSLSLEGAPATVATGVGAIATRAAFWTSPAGAIAYYVGDDLGPQSFSWHGRDGRLPQEAAEEGLYRSVRLSPDGTRAVLSRTVDGDVGIWVRDLARGTWTRVAANTVGSAGPFWSADGRDVIFGQGLGRRKSADGTGSAQPLDFGNTEGRIEDVSADGRWVVLSRSSPETQSDLLLLQVGSTGPASNIAMSKYRESDGRVSWDGRWIAYASDESGRSEVYAQPLPSGPRSRVSIDGGDQPVWRRDGREIFFVGPGGTSILAASVRTVGSGLEFGKPEVVIKTSAPQMSGSSDTYDVSQDGQRFLVLTGNNRGPAVLTVHLNWKSKLPR